MRKFLILLSFAGAILIATAAHAVTASVSLAWNPSSSTNVAAYMVYYGTSSGSYISAVPVQNATNVTINGLNSGTTYYFAATSIDKAGNQSAYSSEISAVAGASGSVTITAQPSNQSAAVGQPATFSVSASGSNLSYQWNFNSSAISNATGSTLTLSNVAAAQAGNYSVNVSSAGSLTSSSAATLTVYATASAILNSSALSAGQFAVGVSGVPGYKYVVMASTDLKNWNPLQTNLAPFNFVDANAAQFNQRFYRTEYLTNGN